MPSVLIRELDDELHAMLRQRARRNRRSMNAEILVLLEAELLPERGVSDRALPPALEPATALAG